MIISEYEVEARKNQLELMKATDDYLDGKITPEEFDVIQEKNRVANRLSRIERPKRPERRIFGLRLW